MSFSLKSIFVILVLLFSWQNVFATHIVGGDLQYRCLGGNQYEVRLTLLRDCYNGSEEAYFDDPANLWIYDENYNPLPIAPNFPDAFLLEYRGTDTLFDISNNPCLDGITGILCVEQTVYKDTITLPYRVGGYRLAYQRCCRNTIIQNIYDPLETGATYELYITDQALEVCNSGPFVSSFPDLYTCLDNEFVFNQTSTDVEGDEIIYKLCTPNSGASLRRPIPYNVPDAPFDTVVWIDSPYSREDMMGNPADPVSITSDGYLSGTPNKLGTYLVGFCIEEYRNGILLSRSNRDYEITILPCNAIPDARIDVPSANCDGTTITFGNDSRDAVDFKWYFDYNGDTTLQSTEFEPTFTYPDTGCYRVALIATLDSTCFDTTYQDICVYNNTQTPDFNAEVTRCDVDINLVLTDASTDSASTIIAWMWNIEFDGNQYTENGQTVDITFDKEGTAIITLTITSANGCQRSITKELDLNFINLELIADSVEICKGESTPLIISGNPDLTYTVDPDVNVDYTDPKNPIVSPIVDTKYYITVSDGLCEVTDSVYVTVRGSDFDIVDLSDTCDINKIFTLTRMNTISDIKWSLDSDFTTIISTEDTLEIIVEDQQTIYARAFDASLDCYLTVAYTVVHKGLALDLNDREYIFCSGDSAIIEITNTNSLEWEIEWIPNDIILSDLTEKEIYVDITEEASEYLYFIATAENGCVTEDSILVRVIGDEVEIIDLSDTCDINKVLTTNLPGLGTVEWSDQPDFTNIIGVGDTLNYEIRNMQTIYVRITFFEQNCIVTGDYKVVHKGLNLDYNTSYSLCQYDTTPIIIKNLNDLEWIIEWEDNPYILSDLNDSILVIRTDTTYSTTLYFRAEAENDCVTEDSIYIEVSPAYKTSFDYEYECGSLMIQLINTSETSDVMWDFGDSNTSSDENPKHTYSTSGTYTITLKTVLDDCETFASETVNIVLIDENLPDVVYACDGDPVSLNPDGSSNYEFKWEPEGPLDDPTSENPTATITDSTLFYVTITNPLDTSCSLLDTVLAVVADIDLDVSEDINVCTMDSVTITGTTNMGTIIWTDDIGNTVGTGESITVKPGDSDSYTATVTVGDCVSTETVNVTVYDLSDLITATADPIEINAGDTVQLDVLGGEAEWTYEWTPEEYVFDPNIKNPQARPLEPTTFCVTVTDLNGCTGESCVFVEVLDNPCTRPYVYIPNAFSPNGDNENDVLYVRGLDIDEMYLMIYDRWGQKVFDSNDKNIGWDGTIEGEDAEDGVYGYYLRVKCFGGDEFIDKGNISLLR